MIAHAKFDLCFECHSIPADSELSDIRLPPAVSLVIFL